MTRWTMARRCARMNPSTIREILKLTEREGVISLAGGLPAAELFPVQAVAEASAAVLRDNARQALQYAPSEGYGPLREWVAADLRRQGVATEPGQILITNGSQQGLDLVGKLLLDPGSRLAVESPTYLGALQAFTPYEPEFVALVGDAQGPLPQALRAAAGARFAYLVPNFQNPSGRCLGAERRAALATAAAEVGLPLVEDNPYGELWLDAPPPPPVAAVADPDGVLLLGSFSKVLVPGLRLGYVCAPKALFPKLLQAKQAADLHTGGHAQRVVHRLLEGGLLAQHLPALREVYRRRRDAMAAALRRYLPPSCRWQLPGGGMFFWVELPEGVDATALLPTAADAGVAYVPGAPFFVTGAARANTLRLSFVTVAPARIAEGVALLGGLLRACLDESDGEGARGRALSTAPTEETLP